VQLLHGIMNSLEVEDVDISENSEEEGFHLFPSVKLGPIDTTKARRLLNWNPTSWIDVLDHTVHFYEEAILEKKFDVARKDVIRTIQQHFSHDSAKIMRGLKHEYGVTFDSAHDEL
jgi:hypothetical protein